MRRSLRVGLLVGLVASIATIAAVSYPTMAVVTANVVKVGPHFTSPAPFDSLLGGQPGGSVRTFLAKDSLKIGDVVYDTTNNTVTKSATLVSYNKLAGVVVGGARTSGRASIVSADVGTLAATANQRVIVLRSGRAWAKTADSVYVGDQVIPSTAVSGTVKRRTTAIDTFNRAFGRAVHTIDSGKAVLLDISVRP